MKDVEVMSYHRFLIFSHNFLYSIKLTDFIWIVQALKNKWFILLPMLKHIFRQLLRLVSSTGMSSLVTKCIRGENSAYLWSVYVGILQTEGLSKIHFLSTLESLMTADCQFVVCTRFVWLTFRVAGYFLTIVYSIYCLCKLHVIILWLIWFFFMFFFFFVVVSIIYVV